jgi:uncharacterized membrane protein
VAEEEHATPTASFPKWLPLTGVALSLLGIADSIYLVWDHYTAGAVLACPDTGIINCTKVTTSIYSEIFGIPVPLLGLAFFIAMLVLQLPAIWNIKARLIVWGRMGFAATGIIMILWFIYVELYRLDAICLFCSGVHLLTLILFGLTAYGTERLSDQS